VRGACRRRDAADDCRSAIEAKHFASESGPEFVDVDYAAARPIRSAPIPAIDATDVFAQSIRTSLHLMSARADALVETLGAEDYRERVKRRPAMLASLDRRGL
jgi:hypothetical protein